MPSASRCLALVPCAGQGLRAGQGGPKQYAQVAGRSVVAHTLAALQACPELHATLVVLAPDDQGFEAQAPAFEGPRAWVARCGGDTRAASVMGGLQALRGQGARDDDWVLVHDAARCLLRPQWVARLVRACKADAVGGLLALPLADTLKAAAPADPAGGEHGEHREHREHRVQATLPRAHLWLAQTPQMFRLGLLQRALAQAGPEVTDEASAVEALGLRPRLVPGEAENFKLTWPADFALAARLLETR